MYGGLFEKGHRHYATSQDCVDWKKRTGSSCVAHSRGVGANARDKRLVWNDKHLKTKSGLRKADLMEHRGRIVSRKAHAHGLTAVRNLVKRDADGMKALRAMRCPKGQHKVNGNCVARSPRLSPKKRRSKKKKSKKKKSNKKKAASPYRRSPYRRSPYRRSPYRRSPSY